MLKAYIEKRKADQNILLMTHIVVGYPNLETSFDLVGAMVEAGVDMMELQFPFSEPIADGPVILHANQKALAGGTRIDDCLRFSERVSKAFDIPFVAMTYYNILYRRGVETFSQQIADAGLAGAIVPDLPPEEADTYLAACNEKGIEPIFIYSPRTPDTRLRYLSDHGKGFIYCVARKGVTGAKTDFSADIDVYLDRCRAATDLPLAVGFGVKNKHDVDYLTGKADIAVVGSQSLRVLDEQGPKAVGDFLKSLR